MIVMDSVHASLPAVPRPSPVPERQRPTPSDCGRDARVTTQVTTQNSTAARDAPGSRSVPSCPTARRQVAGDTFLPIRDALPFLLFFRGALSSAGRPVVG